MRNERQANFAMNAAADALAAQYAAAKRAGLVKQRPAMPKQRGFMPNVAGWLIITPAVAVAAMIVLCTFIR